jgi:sugar/nucleoside kinase (ribokinase family)
VTWQITVAGSLMFDDVRTLHGRRTQQPGGSALYASLAAAQYTRVHVVGAIGLDGEDLVDLLRRPAIEVSNIAHLAGLTSREETVHSESEESTYTVRFSENVYLDWTPILDAPASESPILFLGSMRPGLQLQVVGQTRSKLLAVDTMTYWIREERATLNQVLDASNLLFLNKAELSELVGGAAGIKAVRQVIQDHSLAAVVLKMGSKGAWLISGSKVIRVPPPLLPTVMDPSGAGDAFAGGLLGCLAITETTAPGRRAMEEGATRAAQAIAGFGVVGLM